MPKEDHRWEEATPLHFFTWIHMDKLSLAALLKFKSSFEQFPFIAVCARELPGGLYQISGPVQKVGLVVPNKQVQGGRIFVYPLPFPWEKNWFLGYNPTHPPPSLNIWGPSGRRIWASNEIMGRRGRVGSNSHMELLKNLPWNLSPPAY